MGIKKTFFIIFLAALTFMMFKGNVLADSFRMSRVDSPSMIAGIRIGYKIANGKEVFCLSYAKTTPTAGCTFNQTNYYIDDPGVVRILEYNVNNNKSTRWKYHVKEATLYRYLYEKRGSNIIKSTNGGNTSPNGIGLKQYTNIGGSIWNRVSNATGGLNKTILNQAKNATYKSSGVDTKLSVSTGNKSTATCEYSNETRNVISQLITVKGTGVNMANAKITLNDGNAKVINRQVNGNTLTFNIAYPADSLSAKKNVTATITASSSQKINRYYVYKPGAGCPSNTQETIIMVPEKASVDVSKSVSVEIDPEVCDRYDFRPDSLCLNCDDEDSNWSYIYSDMANWEGIGKSFKSKTSTKIKEYFSENREINGNTIACREQIRVKFPNESNAIQVQTGRYFTVGLPQQYNIGTPNFEPLKVQRTKECHAYTSNGTDMTSSISSAQWQDFWANDTFYKKATSKKSPSEAKKEKNESTGTITLDYNEKNGSGNYNGEKTTETYNTKVEQNNNSLTVTNSYTLTADMYRYIRKDNGLSVSEKPENVEYDDVGIANLPISFNNLEEDGQQYAATLQFDYKIPKDSHLAAAIKDSDYFKGQAIQSNDEDIYKLAQKNGAISANNNSIQKGKLDDNQFNDLKHTACALQYCKDTDLNSGSTNFSCDTGFGKCVADKIDSGKTQKDCSASDNYICNIDFGDDNEYVCRWDRETNTYYIDGQTVTKEEFISKCPCNEENGNFYINNEPVSEEDYRAVCPPGERICPDDDPCCWGYCGPRECPPDEDCDEGEGINVIYRTIDLNNPFPGYNDEKRKTGANWCTYNSADKTINCDGIKKGNNKVVDKVIFKNRGVKTNPEYEYNEDPIYEVKLDASKIQAIRDYNSENEYSDFTLKYCDDETGTACKLNGEVKKLLGVTGQCVNAKGTNFYTCDE